jgi:hypothetical protein
MRILVCIVTTMLAATPMLGQDYRALEGTTITVKIDMPASSDGVDIRPGTDFPLDVPKTADRIKKYGVGVNTGQAIMITKVVVKSRNIEVQLGGGGYGTFGDAVASAAETPTVAYQGETPREKDLKQQLKYTDDYWERQRIRRELDYIESERNRNNQAADQINAQARQMEQINIQQKRATAGSRFNIRYDKNMPDSAATRNGIVAALSRYVDFNGYSGNVNYGPPPPAQIQPSAHYEDQTNALRKGLTIVQVEQILGPAANVSQKNEGSLEITSREYNSNGQHITTQFVGGVLIDYRIVPH